MTYTSTDILRHARADIDKRCDASVDNYRANNDMSESDEIHFRYGYLLEEYAVCKSQLSDVCERNRKLSDDNERMNRNAAENRQLRAEIEYLKAQTDPEISS